MDTVTIPSETKEADLIDRADVWQFVPDVPDNGVGTFNRICDDAPCRNITKHDHSGVTAAKIWLFRFTDNLPLKTSDVIAFAPGEPHGAVYRIEPLPANVALRTADSEQIVAASLVDAKYNQLFCREPAEEQ